MNTDQIFISSSNTEEGKKAVNILIKELQKINRKSYFFENELKKNIVSVNDQNNILEKMTKCGVTILVLSSDFLTQNNFLLKNNNNIIGWNYEEMKASLIWNKEKMHNSIIITYTDEFCNKFLSNPLLFAFPIIDDNIDNIDRIRACEIDSKNYIEIISLTEFLSKSKLYLNIVDKRKSKQANNNLYDLKFI